MATQACPRCGEDREIVEQYLDGEGTDRVALRCGHDHPLFTTDGIPEHMVAGAVEYAHWYPQGYEEDVCECGKPIYRYTMDLIVEWKHFNHATYCDTARAKPYRPKTVIPSATRDFVREQTGYTDEELTDLGGFDEDS